MTLPKILKPKKSPNLIRLGRDNDGGYLVSEKTVNESKTLISFGILDDCSFENDFKKINPVSIFCYDNTVNKSFWIKKIYNDLGAAIYNFNWTFLKNSLKKYFEFKDFFKKKDNYLTISTIKNGSIRKIIKDNNFKAPIFFKIDIEGSEYRILDELIEFQDLICGFAIEFHDLDLHLQKVENFVKNLSLTLIHIHPNNYGALDQKNDPTVIEMTFEKFPDFKSENLILPNKLDQPNDPNNKDISLHFE